jgi:hypothetical protein
MQETTEQIAEPTTPAFADNAGNPWFPRLDYVRIKAIRDRTGLDFDDAERIGRTWALLLRSDETALTVVWLSVVGDDDAAASAEPTEQFLAAMDGPALESAINAFKDALYLFTRPLRRTLLTEGVDAIHQAYQDAIAEAKVGIREALAIAKQPLRGKR